MPEDWHYARGLALCLRIGTMPEDWHLARGLALCLRIGTMLAHSHSGCSVGAMIYVSELILTMGA